MNIRSYLVLVLALALVSTMGLAESTFAHDMGEGFTRLLVYLFGPETVAVAGDACRATQMNTDIMYGTCQGLPLILFFFILPGLIMFAILYDMLLFMGFLRKWTAQTIAFAMAFFAARTGAYFKLAYELNSFFNNTLISMVSLLFTMMVFWWVLGHILYGFQLNREILRTQSAITYLDQVGRTLQERVRS